MNTQSRTATLHIRSRRSISPLRRVISMLVAAMTTVLVTSCTLFDVPKPPQGAPDPATLIQETIDAINNAPANWRENTSALIDKLNQSGSEFLKEVQSLYNDALGQTQNFVYCTVDFFGRRVAEGLADVLHRISPSHPAPMLTPTVCHTDPSQFVDAGKTKLITYYGYDFNKYNESSPFAVILRYADGQVISNNFAAVNIVHNYQMNVEFQSYDFSKLDRSRHPSVVLSWTNGPVRADTAGASSSLPVIIPEPPRPPKTDARDFAFHFYVEPAPLWQTDDNCTEISSRRDIQLPSGWRIDSAMGDQGHPGVSQVSFEANEQAKATLRGYNYQVADANHVLVSATKLCGRFMAGPGAELHVTTRVFFIENRA